MQRPREASPTRDPREEAVGVDGGRREFVRLDGTRVPRVATADDRVRRDATSNRSAGLQEAIRKRFPTAQDFDAWNDALAARDPRLALQLSRIFTDIDRGHTPTTHHICALAAAAGWSLERVCQTFDVDLHALPRLHRALGGDRTRTDFTGYGFSGTLAVPTDLAPGLTRVSTMPMTELVGGWSRQPGGAWAAPEQRLMGQVGRFDNLAYPRLPSGAQLLIDTSNTRPTDSDAYYLVQHPNGFSCARTAMENGILSILSEDRDRYPRLDFSLKEVRICGRVIAFAGRVDRLRPPTPVGLGDLIDIRRPLLTLQRLRDLSAPALLRDLWVRRALSFSQFERKVRTLRRLVGARFTIGRGHMHDLMQADAASQESTPRLERLFALAATFLLDPRDLLRAYGVPIDELAPAGRDESATVRTRVDQLRQHPAVANLLARGWDLAWLLSLYRGPTLSSRLFLLDEIHAGLSPLLKPGAFVSVNIRQRHIVSSVQGRAVETLRDWERPIYLLQTSTRHRFVCGYCERQRDQLTVVPHPEAPSQRPLRFRFPDQAIVIGRVRHVATLLP